MVAWCVSPIGRGGGSFPEGRAPISRGSGGNDMITSACAECAGAVVEREEIGS